jgi:heterodisulfide reductase subunit A-like polyferredoxin
MDIKVLLCNCKGLCDSFKAADMNTLPFAVESDLDVQYSILHPQLCGQGGNAVLTDVFKSAGPDTCVLVGACAPETQAKLFKRVMRTTGFDERRFVPVDIRGTDNDGIEQRLKEPVQGILKRAAEGAPATAAG